MKQIFLTRIIFFIFIFSSFKLYSQDLSRGYKDILLGMQKEKVQELLKTHIEFDVKKEEVLTIRIEPDKEIITVDGFGFIKIAYFHFSDDKLYQIFIKFDESKISYYNLLDKFTKKYKKPDFLEPKKAYWENDEVRVVIEKESVMKYIDLPVWKSITKVDLNDRKVKKKVRDRFLDDL